MSKPHDDAVCNQDCFNCPYPDCILDVVSEDDAAADSAVVDRISVDEYERGIREEKEKRHQYYIKNRQKCLEASRKWRAENRERALSGQLKWYYEHKEKRPRSNKNKPKAVISTDGSGKETRYVSINAAARESNVRAGNICNACKGKPGYKTAGGYRWRYAEEEL